MKNKLYLAVMWGLTGAMAGEVGAAVDLFNSPVGVIGTQAAAAAEIKAPQAAPAQAAPVATDNKAAAAEASAPQAAKSKLWSYQPVKAPAQPTVNNKNWVRTPLDAFVLAPLEAKGLTPSADTDRAAFVRRATLDAWGVIPTPEDVASFVSDTAPDAYEKLADRLLASPKYGERQARRWLDLARYADSTGFQNDETRPNLWRYRDYVINAFNQDKPYSRFIQEQLAGDELWPDNQEALIATGYMANFPDNHNSRDLVQRKYQITTDITDTVGKVFLGQTVECARCHNHKFDKISQKDYFSLQAFFANLSAVDNIPAAKKGEVERKYDVTLAKWEDATKEIRGKQKAIIDTVREQAEKHHKERYLTDSREAIFKPKSQWNAQDRWINHRLGYITDERSLAAYLRDTAESKGADKNYTKEIADKWTEYDKLSEELKKFNDLKPKSGSTEISAMTELGYPDAPPSYVFFGGDHERPLEQVQPAFPEAITDEKPDIKPTAFSSGRRTALANWIASSNNPLTARVFVNRVGNNTSDTASWKQSAISARRDKSPPIPSYWTIWRTTSSSKAGALRNYTAIFCCPAPIASHRLIVKMSPKRILTTSFWQSSRGNVWKPNRFATRYWSLRENLKIRSAVRAYFLQFLQTWEPVINGKCPRMFMTRIGAACTFLPGAACLIRCWNPSTWLPRKRRTANAK